ncbi:histidine phosphotransferase [Campylobacter insulaenigrae]|uniref:Histidine phosphotransferase n=1 Tax=Campylobacter insulaenigrae TaxID=260714 RepID=A0ABY3G626_9BACT|nr:histidine phosphotransferase [Campylobacter insulaenigrae]MCR6570914.1 histidine phosphotransferase [Campylobacter insulaenigrae]MCR6574127.1 histidine phosphotransferase [Campylobacter insulaenigrae]MCR6578642.1 histidine phosphotransferase [Campylobacter insulaenigrae]MCR6580076.1 histidine phosphotransferase [Campylobacter insulaenigrae]MCR6583282.1 histidine phosphotransferase [Campylobacter insulaenigrae]
MGILEQLERDYELEEIERFLYFFRSLCDILEPLIVKLSSSSEKYKEALRDLEQNIHNVVWAAKRLNLEELVNFGTFCEEITKQALKFEGPASEEFTDWMLLISDQFEKYCCSYENDDAVLAIFNPLIANVPDKISQ